MIINKFTLLIIYKHIFYRYHKISLKLGYFFDKKSTGFYLITAEVTTL